MGALQIDCERVAGSGDWLIALLLAEAAQYELGGRVARSRRRAGAERGQCRLRLARGAPAGVARRAPLAVLFTVLTGSTVESAAFASFPSFEPFVALLVAVHSVGAHCERRQAVIGAGFTFELLVFGELAPLAGGGRQLHVGAVVVCAAA